MKKILALTLSMGLLSFSAFAQDEFEMNEQDASFMAESADVEAMDAEFDFYSTDAVVGGIIGGAVGAIGADRWDRERDRDRGGRHWATCYAQNRRGQTFAASGRSAWQAQNQAMRRCLNVSRACRQLGCR